MNPKKIGFYLMVIFGSFGCKEGSIPFYQISAPTMGTKYHITVQTNSPEKIKHDVDSILDAFNLSMSLYIDSSTIVNFNKADSIYCFDPKKDPFFLPIFERAKIIYKNTSGAFDPSIAPLVNYYGFGYKEKKHIKDIDTVFIKKLLSLMVFDSISISHDSLSGQLCIIKPNKGVMLDFNSLSPGYVADVIYQHFVKSGIKNFMINVGGEIKTLGTNDQNQDWVIGINKPSENSKENEIELPLVISNKALATSGNYRNAYESKGQKYAHIINPYTGMSQPTDILSATVIADDCVDADAYATAFMVLGLEKSLALVSQLKGIEACFIYDSEGDGIFEFKVSEGFSKYYKHNEQK